MKKLRFVVASLFASIALALAPVAAPTALVAVALSISAPSAHAADISITAANVKMSPAGRSLRRTAFEAINAGQPVYLSTSDNKFHLCDNNASLAASKVFGIAVQSVTANQPLIACYWDPKFVLGATIVVGDNFWTSGTAGGITNTAADNVTGMYISWLGIAVSTTEIYLDPHRADVIKP
jgi:hypothetical protein